MRYFSARETEWMQELDGIELAPFVRRCVAFLIDWILIVFVLAVVAVLTTTALVLSAHRNGLQTTGFTYNVREGSMGDEFAKLAIDLLIPVLYFGVLLWCGHGRTPGKYLMGIRVVSLVHRHLSFWHSVERALGYGSAALEGGFGFLQFFFHPYRRCAQDRLAETLVVTERGYQAMHMKRQHPLLPDLARNRQAPE